VRKLAQCARMSWECVLNNASGTFWGPRTCAIKSPVYHGSSDSKKGWFDSILRRGIGKEGRGLSTCAQGFVTQFASKIDCRLFC